MDSREHFKRFIAGVRSEPESYLDLERLLESIKLFTKAETFNSNTMIKSILVKARYVRVSLKEMRKPHLGDVVTYQGERCSLIQGRNAPRWNLLPMTKENLDRSKREVYREIHERDFKLDPLYKRGWWAFGTMYRFLMSNWYHIDCRNRKSLRWLFGTRS